MSAGDPGTTTGERALVVVDVRGYRRPDLVLVDTLTRVRLVAGRLGARIAVQGAGPDLVRLLEFVGVRTVVPLVDPAALSEPGGQPEALEEPGVEEVVDVLQPPVPELEDLDRPRFVPPTRPARPVLGEGG
jgi:hypothetical protein